MSKRQHHALHTLLVLTASCLFIMPPSARAQISSVPAPYTPTMKFDVASIRESPEADSYLVSGSFADHASSLHVTNFDVMNLLCMAFNIQYYQLASLPDWRAMFNIEAKSGSDTDQQLAKLNKKQTQLEQQHMLQTLLIDRFNLRVHWETRQAPTYRLILKGTPRLQETRERPPTPEELKTWDNKPAPSLYQQGDSGTGFDFIAHGCSMNDLVEALAGQFGSPVSDQTGLAGHYDFILHYKGARVSDRSPDDMCSVPPLDQAIQDQLGLKLEPTKSPIQVLVIDHIEKPSPN